jgi:hypothetical protein
VERGEEVFPLYDYFSVAGGVMTELQKLRLMAGCRPNLVPDVPTVVREALRMHGLLPEQQQPTPLAGLSGAAADGPPPPLDQADPAP